MADSLESMAARHRNPAHSSPSEKPPQPEKKSMNLRESAAGVVCGPVTGALGIFLPAVGPTGFCLLMPSFCRNSVIPLSVQHDST